MKQSSLKSFARYSGLAVQMGATIYLGSLLGGWLDTKYPNDEGIYAKWVTLTAVLLSTVSTILQVIRQQNKQNA